MTPIELQTASGQTIYAVIHNPDGRVWNAIDAAWEAYNAAHWAQYAIPFTEQAGSGYYRAAYPTELSESPETLTSEACYIQAGGGPAVGDAPAGLGQSQGVNLAAVDNDFAAVDNFHQSLVAMVQGQVAAGDLTNRAVITDLESDVDDTFVGRLLVMLSGGTLRQVANILSYNGETKQLTFAPLTAAPEVGDRFIIV